MLITLTCPKAIIRVFSKEPDQIERRFEWPRQQIRPSGGIIAGNPPVNQACYNKHNHRKQLDFPTNNGRQSRRSYTALHDRVASRDNREFGCITATISCDRPICIIRDRRVQQLGCFHSGNATDARATRIASIRGPRYRAFERRAQLGYTGLERKIRPI